MQDGRMVSLCAKLDVILTEQEMLEVRGMTNSKGERKIRKIAAQRSNISNIQSINNLSKPAFYWSREDLVRAANDRGKALEAMEKLRDEMLHWFAMAAKIAAERDEAIAIARAFEADGGGTEETKESSANPQQQHLPLTTSGL
jgi:hypothetical protein